MYAAGSCSSYSSCSLQVARSTRPPLPLGLGDPEAPLGGHVGIGEPEACEVRHFLLAGIAEAAAAHLGRALEQVARGGGGRHARPVVVAPAEVVHRRGDEERGIGDPAGDHDLRPRLERAADDVGAEICVAGDHSGQQRFERLAGFHQRQLRLPAEDLRDVVAEHHRAAHLGEAEVLGVTPDVARRGGRVRGAHVADDPHAVLQARRQHRPHPVEQPRRIALVGILQPGEVLARDRALGEALEREIVDLAPLGELDCRRDPVVGKARSRADSKNPFRFHVSLRISRAWRRCPSRAWTTWRARRR